MTDLVRKWMQPLQLNDTLSNPSDQKPTRFSVLNNDVSVQKSDSNTAQPREYLSRASIPQAPDKQHQLLIHAPKESFRLKEDAKLPSLRDRHEVLIRIDSVGLNPIDWKSPAYGWGLPGLPCVLGRDYLGTVVETQSDQCQGDTAATGNLTQRVLCPGNVVLAISTDYRDYRKAAFQQFSVAQNFNVSRVPASLLHLSASLPAIGVAYVTAALSLGVCLGLNFDSVASTPGPDLFSIVRGLQRKSLPEDIRTEVFDALAESERIRPGDWIAVWGASSTVGFLTVQLAKKAGLKVVAVADLTKKASKLVDIGADVLVHRANPEETVEIITSLTEGKNLRYGVDVVGKETSAQLESTFRPLSDGTRSHLVCLVGSPKLAEGQASSTTYHKLPMKLFHESPAIGLALMMWLEDLLFSGGDFILPKIEIHSSKGLEGINAALERLRDDKIDGQRLVVELE